MRSLIIIGLAALTLTACGAAASAVTPSSTPTPTATPTPTPTLNPALVAPLASIQLDVTKYDILSLRHDLDVMALLSANPTVTTFQHDVSNANLIAWEDANFPGVRQRSASMAAKCHGSSSSANAACMKQVNAIYDPMFNALWAHFAADDAAMTAALR